MTLEHIHVQFLNTTEHDKSDPINSHGITVCLWYYLFVLLLDFSGYSARIILHIYDMAEIVIQTTGVTQLWRCEVVTLWLIWSMNICNIIIFEGPLENLNGPERCHRVGSHFLIGIWKCGWQLTKIMIISVTFPQWAPCDLNNGNFQKSCFTVTWQNVCYK